MSSLRERIKDQARNEERMDDYGNEDEGIKNFTAWVCRREEYSALSKKSGLSSFSADVDLFIMKDDDLEEMYAKFQIEGEEE